MNRRNFLSKTGNTLGAAGLIGLTGACMNTLPGATNEWTAVRNRFQLTKDKIQMAQFLLASHPDTVREAIDRHRRAFDHNPFEYYEHNIEPMEAAVQKAAAEYLKCDPAEIALTDSTTMGLGTLYAGLKLKSGDEILSTTHDHYSTEKSLEYAAHKTGASLRRVPLYANPATTSIDEILSNLKNAIRPETRIVAVTFVHSLTGVKLPVPQMSAVIREANQNRDEEHRIYFCVDSVHGFGVENITAEEMGCDFLVAGTHKWLFGPRGTGIIWGKRDAWHMVEPTIPPFSVGYYMWMNVMPETELDFFSKMTPGGFHSFENRWALKEAFEFHLEMGKEKIRDRTYELNKMLKNAMAEMPHVTLHTPMTTDLSCGINAFEVRGMDPYKLVEKLYGMNIIASTTPYKIIYARLTPCILNSEEDVTACIEALESFA